MARNVAINLAKLHVFKKEQLGSAKKYEIVKSREHKFRGLISKTNNEFRAWCSCESERAGGRRRKREQNAAPGGFSPPPSLSPSLESVHNSGLLTLTRVVYTDYGVALTAATVPRNRGRSPGDRGIKGRAKPEVMLQLGCDSWKRALRWSRCRADATPRQGRCPNDTLSRNQRREIFSLSLAHESAQFRERFLVTGINIFVHFIASHDISQTRIIRGIHVIRAAHSVGNIQIRFRSLFEKRITSF